MNCLVIDLEMCKDIEGYEDYKDTAERVETYDGGIFASGTHTVVGTVLVCTSNELKKANRF